MQCRVTRKFLLYSSRVNDMPVPLEEGNVKRKRQTPSVDTESTSTLSMAYAAEPN